MGMTTQSHHVLGREPQTSTVENFGKTSKLWELLALYETPEEFGGPPEPDWRARLPRKRKVNSL